MEACFPADTGALINARVMRDRQTGVSQGFAFLEFTSRLAAQQVLNMYDGKHIHANLVLRLNWAAFGLGRATEGNLLFLILMQDVLLAALTCSFKGTYQDHY